MIWEEMQVPYRRRLLGGVRHFPRTILFNIQLYLHSIDNIWVLGLFNSAAVALISHKILIIDLHGPLSNWGLLIAGPCLFVFDLLTLMILHSGLASAKAIWKGVAALAALLIMVCSATFASLYLEGNAELNWSRSVGVIADWRFFSKLMAQGSNGFGKVFALYGLAGALTIPLRHFLGRPERLLKSPTSNTSTTLGLARRILALPFVPVLMCLLVASAFLPPSPWRHLTSTLAYDVTTAMSSALLSSTFRRGGECGKESVSNNPFGNLNYDPANDPYYVSNIHLPIDDFIRSALEDTKFTNIVHIVLESMREDSYPFQEDGLLNQHIRAHERPVRGGTPVNTETLTPFIASLAEHTISWHTMWSTIPYTHKAMLGYWCGMLPVPLDWAVEANPPAKFYQHCLPQVFRYMNSVTDREAELMDVFRNITTRTTDQWETVHIHSSTGEWDWARDIIKGSGFNTVILAEDLAKLNGGQEFPNTFGYFDDESIQYLWKYVDNAIARSPKNRMYLSWKTTTTHTPLILPPAWRHKNLRSYLEKGENSELWHLREHLPLDNWLNAVRWTDDNVKEIILGFRERGLEDETLFVIHGDHGIPFLGDWRTPVNNPHNEPYRVPFMIYNPRIKNPQKKKMEGSYYSLSIPTTILDLMAHTKSFGQQAQQLLARQFGAKYEHAQSLLRPVVESIRFFTVDPGGGYWILDNGRNLRCKFELVNDNVRLVDYVTDPMEYHPMETWGGVEALIAGGAEQRFGPGTTEFLREADMRQEYMKSEIIRRYGMESVHIDF